MNIFIYIHYIYIYIVYQCDMIGACSCVLEIFLIKKQKLREKEHKWHVSGFMRLKLALAWDWNILWSMLDFYNN